jgi:N-carbamoylputrescine amidase
VLTATFDLNALAQQRNNWFVFRDRRPELYAPLLSLDGGRGV